jgi:hypothetical protein
VARTTQTDPSAMPAGTVTESSDALTLVVVVATVVTVPARSLQNSVTVTPVAKFSPRTTTV